MIFDPISLQRYRLVYLRLRAVGGSSRFYLLSILNNQPNINVGKLVEFTKMDQPIVSQHLAVLKKAGLIMTSAHKKERFYAINKKEVGNLISLCHQLRKEDNGEMPILKNAYPIFLQAYRYFKFLLHPGRLVLIELINRNGPSSVKVLSDLSKQSQSITSQNLKFLFQLDMVIKKEEGRNAIYTLNPSRQDYLHALIEKYC